jgi:hypothetical protein
VPVREAVGVELRRDRHGRAPEVETTAGSRRVGPPKLIVHQDVRAVVARFGLPSEPARVGRAVAHVAGSQPGLRRRGARRALVPDLADGEHAAAGRTEAEAGRVAVGRGLVSRGIQAALGGRLEVGLHKTAQADVERRRRDREVREAHFVGKQRIGLTPEMKVGRWPM